MIGATSAMWVKARVCMPSPKTGIGFPCSIAFMKMPMTLR